MLLRKGAGNVIVNLTSFSRELSRNFWPGAVFCCCYCGGGTGAGFRLSLAQSRGVRGSGGEVLFL